jgi:drug/metabolite transporter (DMT)-like permease
MLTKSGVTFITALTSVWLLGSRIAKLQWMAIVFQISGLIVTQYQPRLDMSYPLSTYFILMFQVFLSAVAGVYNQGLLNADENPSLHASNMVLYGSGVLVNAWIYFTIKIFKADEPAFFTGFDSVGAVLVVASNITIGLVITAVYKCRSANILLLTSY